MLVNSITNFKYDMSNKVANHKQDAQQAQSARDEGLTASIYFGTKNKGNKMRNATMAFVAPIVLSTAVLPSVTSCDKDESWAKSESYSNSSASASDSTKIKVCTHAKGCCCHSCKKGKDTVYQIIPGPVQYIYLPGDTVKLPGDTIKLPGDTVRDTLRLPGDTVEKIVEKEVEKIVEVPKEIPIYIYVDTGSYHVKYDTITQWKDRWEKPIPLDTLAKITEKFDIDCIDPSRKNIVSYQGIREWEYGNRFATMMNQLQSNKYELVYDREDFDWEGHHIGYGKDVFRYPRTNFKIETYEGKVINNPKGLFIETYTNPFNSKESAVSDNELVTRQFIQTRGDSVYVFTYDKSTGLYREDGRISKGYLENNSVLLTDLIASDPDKKFGRDPEYSTEDHIVSCKVATVNDEELELLYVRAKDDEVAEKLYGTASNTRSAFIANPWGLK